MNNSLFRLMSVLLLLLLGPAVLIESGLGESGVLKSAWTNSALAKEIPVRVSADSENQSFEAYRAMDGNVDTLWHTQFSGPPQNTADFPFPISCGYGFGCNSSHPHSSGKPVQSTGNNVPPPHQLKIDLQGEYELTGFVYHPRQHLANGAIGKYEFFVTKNEQEQCQPVAQGEFPRSDEPVRVLFDQPVKGRYVKFVALSEMNGQPFTSVAELTLLSEGNTFVPEVGGVVKSGLQRVARTEQDRELCDEFNVLIGEFEKPQYYAAIKDQVPNEQLLIFATDRDPVDVVFRRTFALLEELKELQGSQGSQNALDYSTAFKAVADLLETAREQVRTIPVNETQQRFDLFKRIATIRRELMFAHPLLNFDKLLFVKKHRATFEHMCDQFYGINSEPGGGLYVLENPFDPTGKGQRVRNLLEKSVVENGRLRGTRLDSGSFVSPALSYDGNEIAFAFVEGRGTKRQSFHTDLSRGHWNKGRSFHIFRCNSDGTGLNMMTDGTWNDFDPCFLPNGRVAFISERRGGYLRCGRECPTYTLFDMNPDGTQMRCLSYHETNEWNPSVTNDGKIIWTRWDYVDRFGCVAHHPWTTSLDGRDPRAVHGNYSPRHVRPDCEFSCRAIPNSPKYIATAGPHHGQLYGSIILIDPQVEDDDNMGPVKRLTPDVGFPESQGGGQVYGTPWALSENLFLAVADYGFQPNGGIPHTNRGDYGIYLCDSFGNRELVYRDPELGSISPIPFVARPKPIVAPDLIPLEEIKDQPYVALPEFDGPRPLATVTISNVYQSRLPLPPDTKIKELRVVQIYCMSVPSGWNPHETGPREPSSLDSVNLTRGVLGTVPVEEDGSAHFTVPANMEIFFQLLDENGLAVQSMRSATNLHEGETLSCVGCHEPKYNAPLQQTSELPIAFRRPPSTLKPDVFGTRPANFPLLVQPLIEEKCLDCHNSEIAKGTPKVLDFNREPIQNKWYRSYNELVGKGYAFIDYGNPLRTIPGQFGARHSKLYDILKDGKHHELTLTVEEMHKITVWLDMLSPFYGVYEKEGGERQLRGEVAYPTLE